MQIRVGLTTNDLTILFHKTVVVTAADGLSCSFGADDSSIAKSAPGAAVTISAKGNRLHISGVTLPILPDGSSLLVSALEDQPHVRSIEILSHSS